VTKSVIFFGFERCKYKDCL